MAYTLPTAGVHVTGVVFEKTIRCQTVSKHRAKFNTLRAFGKLKSVKTETEVVTLTSGEVGQIVSGQIWQYDMDFKDIQTIILKDGEVIVKREDETLSPKEGQRRIKDLLASGWIIKEKKTINSDWIQAGD